MINASSTHDYGSLLRCYNKEKNIYVNLSVHPSGNIQSYLFDPVSGKTYGGLMLADMSDQMPK